MQQGFLYLVAIIDWATRRVLSWRLSNTLTAGFCVEGAERGPRPVRQARHLQYRSKPALAKAGGAQFTSDEFTNTLRDHRIEISIDGRGRCHDNIFVERLWWTVKHEWVYLRPAARNFAADAHDCIMVRIRTDLPDTSSRREDAPQWRVPFGSYPDRQCRHPSSAGKARLAVHPPSACSGVKALRNTSNAKRQAAKLC